MEHEQASATDETASAAPPPVEETSGDESAVVGSTETIGQPVVVEPVAVEPVVGEAVAVEPVAVEPVAVEPVAVEPVATESVVGEAEPVNIDPPNEIVDATTFKYQPGDIVPGTIVTVGANGIEADLGDGVVAVIPRAEIDGADPALGQAIEGTVIRHQAGTGRYVISPKRAARTRAWSSIVAAFESGTPVTGRVKESTKGGLIVDLGLRAFLPDSLIDVRKGMGRDLIGKEVTVMIIECEKLTGEVAAAERRSEKIVVNRRAMVEQDRKAARARLFTELEVGEKRTGRVSALTDFGAFVDIGGVEGLVHVSELAHRQVAKPADVVKVGDTFDVIVLEIKPEKGKISLSRKAALPNPWSSFQSSHKVGDLVFGTVSGLAPFGAFVAIETEDHDAVEGLVHISELSRFRVESASEVVAVGEGVWTQILAIEPEKRRISLSLRRALE